MEPVIQYPGLRRDAIRTLRSAAADGALLRAAADRLPDVKGPALVVWAAEDRIMPAEHGQGLAALLPYGRLVEVPDRYALVPLDQPARLAQLAREFVTSE